MYCSESANFLDDLQRYLQIVWSVLRDHGEARHVALESLRASLAEGPYGVRVQVFDSAGTFHALVQFTPAGPCVGADEGADVDASWVVSRRFLADVLRRPGHYLEHPARLDLGWLSARSAAGGEAG